MFSGADVEQHDMLGLASSAGCVEAQGAFASFDCGVVEDEQHELFGFVVASSRLLTLAREAVDSELEEASVAFTPGWLFTIALLDVSVDCSTLAAEATSDFAVDIAAAFLEPQQPPSHAMVKSLVVKVSYRRGFAVEITIWRVGRHNAYLNR